MNRLLEVKDGVGEAEGGGRPLGSLPIISLFSVFPSHCSHLGGLSVNPFPHR